MNSLLEEMTALRDANTVLIDLVCDPNLSLQGLMIIERIQIRLCDLQMGILKELRFQLTVGANPANPQSRGIH